MISWTDSVCSVLSQTTGKDDRILVVDDDPTSTALLSRMLEQWGYEDVFVTNESSAAVGLCRRTQPDLVLLDVMMPKVSGFDVLDILRNTPETANLKIVMLTALSQDSDKQRAETLGVDDYLVKSQW